MGRRRRQKVRRRPQKKIPDVFDCPQCGEAAIQIVIFRNNDFASVKCGRCGLQDTIDSIGPLTEAVDVFGDFIDQYYEARQAA
jgi:transcription elongation factor Elf1